MEKKYMLPPEKPKNPRIGPEFQAQIPDFCPPEFQPKKRHTEPADEPAKKSIEESSELPQDPLTHN